MDRLVALESIDLTIVAIYLVLTAVAGVLLSRIASKNIDAYFLGNRRLPWWVLGMSGTASNFDMTGTMVMVSFFFAIGLQGFWVSMRGGMCLLLGILMVYMGKWLRRSEVMTTAEWMELRFGAGMGGQAARLLSAVANLVFAVAMLTYFVKGTGKFMAVFLPFSPETCALIMVTVGLSYTALSGLYGVVWTDVLQEVLFFSASVYLGVKAFNHSAHEQVLSYAGAAWSSFFPRWTAEPMGWLSDPHMYQFFGLCIVFWMAKGLLEGAGGLTGGYMPQRYYAARTPREASLMTAEWIVLLLFRWALIIGVALLAMWLSMEDGVVAEMLAADPEKALPVVLGRVVPAGLRGLLVAGLVAAAMSTFDSTVNAGAAYWVKDIYQRYLRPQADQKTLVRQGRWATVVLAGLAFVVALGVHNIDAIWSWITGPLSAGLFAPIVLRWYWWRFNGYGFAVATGMGLLVSVGLRLLVPDCPLWLAFPLTWTLSLLGGVVTTWVSPPPSDEVLKRFFVKVRPFGWWRPVRKLLGDQQDMLSRARAERRRDIPTAVLATAWHLSGVVAVISLIMHKFATMTWALGVFMLLAVGLYFVWYRKLGSCCRESGSNYPEGISPKDPDY